MSIFPAARLDTKSNILHTKKLGNKQTLSPLSEFSSLLKDSCHGENKYHRYEADHIAGIFPLNIIRLIIGTIPHFGHLS